MTTLDICFNLLIKSNSEIILLQKDVYGQGNCKLKRAECNYYMTSSHHVNMFQECTGGSLILYEFNIGLFGVFFVCLFLFVPKPTTKAVWSFYTISFFVFLRTFHMYKL